MPENQIWHLYILRCSDDSFYTGIAQDVNERVARHNRGDGAAFTKSRRPVQLLFSEDLGADKKKAQARERTVKKMSRQRKLALIDSAQTPRRSS